MVPTPGLCLVFFSLLCNPSFATDSLPFGDWFNPPRSIGPTVDYSSNPVYVVGETTELNWTTVYTNYSIALWQQHPGGGWATLGPVIYQTFEQSNNLFNWSVSPLRFNLTVSNIFYLWLYPGASTQQGSDAPKEQPSITTHYFNITEAQGADTTGSSSTTVSSSSSSSSASPTTSTGGPISVTVSVSTTSLSVTETPTTSPKEHSTSQPSTGLGAAAWAGIGVGAALGGIITCAGGIFWFRRRQQRKLQPKIQPHVPGHSELPGWGRRKTVVPLKQRWPAEAPAWRSPAELDDTMQSGRFRTFDGPPPMSPRELPG